MRGRIQLVGLAVLTLALPSSLVAQPKPGYEPSSTHIFPAGGQRGTTVDVLVGTECFPPGARFAIVGTGVAAPAILNAEVMAEGEPAPRRAPTETPITYPRQWRSQIEIRPHAPLGAAFWRSSCAQGGTASRPFIIGDLPEMIEAESNSMPRRAEEVRLPVTINGQIHGERDADYFRFAATKGQVVQCDVMARRLGSRLDPVVQILNETGQAVSCELTHIGSDPQLRFTPKADSEYLLRVAHVTHHGSPAHVYRINLTQGAAREVAAGEEEQEPNNDARTANELAEPAVIDGSFSAARDEDWFAFAAEKGQWFSIRCAAQPQGTSALPIVALLDAQGEEQQLVNSVEAADRVCRLQWQAPATGRFLLRARDIRFGSQGGAPMRYRLSVRSSAPRFELFLPTDSVNVGQDGAWEIEVAARRHGGFDGEIQLVVDGLPDNVTVAGATIAAKASRAKIEFAATGDAQVADWRLRIVGRAKFGDQQLESVARAAHLGRDEEGVSVGAATVDWLYLTVCHRPVFRLFCSEHYQYARRGTVYQYLMEIERLAGFAEEVTLQIGDRQNRDLDGIQFHEVVIPSARSSGLLPIYLPETMHINVQSQSQLYAQGYASFVDKHGRKQNVLVLSEKQNMLRTMPPVVKLQAAEELVTTEPGDRFVCNLQLKRTSNFLGPMTLELLDDSGDFKIEPAEFGQGQSEAAVTVRSAEQLRCEGQSMLRFRATGKLADGTTVISETSVAIQVK